MTSLLMPCDLIPMMHIHVGEHWHKTVKGYWKSYEDHNILENSQENSSFGDTEFIFFLLYDKVWTDKVNVLSFCVK